MGFLNYQDNQGRIQDWEILKLKNAKSITLCLFITSGIMAIGVWILFLTNIIAELSDLTTTFISLLAITLFTTVLMGLYTLKLFIRIKFFRRK